MTKRRRPSPTAQRAWLLREAQQMRLRALLAGDLEPRCLREEYFLQMARLYGPPDLDEFTLPRALYNLEEFERGRKEAEDADPPNSAATSAPSEI